MLVELDDKCNCRVCRLRRALNTEYKSIGRLAKESRNDTEYVRRELECLTDIGVTEELLRNGKESLKVYRLKEKV